MKVEQYTESDDQGALGICHCTFEAVCVHDNSLAMYRTKIFFDYFEIVDAGNIFLKIQNFSYRKIMCEMEKK